MTIILKPGQKKKNYEVLKELSRGAFSVSYEARNSTGESVFLKQYKSPSKLIAWYHGFVKHQEEIKKRIEADPAAKQRCYRFIEFFEEEEFFQVFEFIDHGKALSDCIAQIDRFDWNQIVIFAKVMMFGIKALHDIKVVHCDLKPDNIMLIPDSTVGVGYRLRVIDLDWSIFSDKKAPWHDKQGYVGSPFYQSPEHVRGSVPLPASDIFTSGIMLGQLLGNGHPFAKHTAEDAQYDRAIKAGDFEPIKIRELLPGSVDMAMLHSILNACLHPNAKNRPTATEVCDALLGKKLEIGAGGREGVSGKSEAARRGGKGVSAKSEAARRGGKGVSAKPVAARRVETPATSPGATKPLTAHVRAIEIQLGNKRLTTVSTDATLGKMTFKALDTDAQFLSDAQFRIYRNKGVWSIDHCAAATNQTLVNGTQLEAPLAIENGMRIAVGNAAKGIEKCVAYLYHLA